jgi:hypothetical protein
MDRPNKFNPVFYSKMQTAAGNTDDVFGIPYVNTDDIDGLLVDEKDNAALASAHQKFDK